MATFVLPSAAATFGLRIDDLHCTVAYTPPLNASAPLSAVPVAGGDSSLQPLCMVHSGL